MTRPLLLAVALAAAAPAAAPAAEPLGRLFYTPAQRVQLDAARSQRSRGNLQQPEETPLPETVSFDGMVRRSDGRSTVWINNRAVSDKELTGGRLPVAGRVRPDGGLTLQVPQTGDRIDLRVGQSVEILSRTVEEPYARRKPPSTPEPPGKPAQPKPDAAPRADAPAGNAPAGDGGGR